MHETGIWKIRNNDTAERCYGTSFLIFKLPFCGKSCLTDFAKKFTFSILIRSRDEIFLHF